MLKAVQQGQGTQGGAQQGQGTQGGAQQGQGTQGGAQQGQGTQGGAQQGQGTQGGAQQGQGTQGGAQQGQGTQGGAQQGQGTQGGAQQGQTLATQIKNLAQQITQAVLGTRPQYGSAKEAHETGPVGLRDDKVVTGLDVRKAMEAAGLGAAANDLRLPQNMQELIEQSHLNQMQTKQNISEIRSLEARGESVPGKLIMDSYDEYIAQFVTTQTSWRLRIRDAVLGSGIKTDVIDDVPDDIFYIEPYDMGFQDEAGLNMYEPAELPIYDDEKNIIVTIVDTSYSISSKMLTRFVSEIKELIDEAAQHGKALKIFFGDTILRGKPIELNLENFEDLENIYEELKKVKGRTGTDIEKCIINAIKYLKKTDNNIEHIVYFSDLEDAIPNLKNIMLETELSDPVPTTFVTLEENSYLPGWEAAAKTQQWFQVVYIQQGTDIEVDLDFHKDLPAPEKDTIHQRIKMVV
jgi:hypothetical protein